MTILRIGEQNIQVQEGTSLAHGEVRPSRSCSCCRLTHSLSPIIQRVSSLALLVLGGLVSLSPPETFPPSHVGIAIVGLSVTNLAMTIFDYAYDKYKKLQRIDAEEARQYQEV